MGASLPAQATSLSCSPPGPGVGPALPTHGAQAAVAAVPPSPAPLVASTVLERLGSLYRAHSEISQVIVRGAGEAELLAAVCRVAVDCGRLRMAWIGVPHAGTTMLQAVAQYGAGLEYLQDLRISVDANRAEGRGPTGRAYRNADY